MTAKSRMEEPVLSEMTAVFSNDVRRINHALKVYSFSKIIAGGEKLSDMQYECLMYAAVLHDIGIKNAEARYGSGSGRYQEIEGPPVAEAILVKLGVERSVIDRVCFLVGHHHSYDKIDGPYFRILVEADCIVNMHEDNLSKTVVEKMKKNLFRTETGIELVERLYLVNDGMYGENK